MCSYRAWQCIRVLTPQLADLDKLYALARANQDDTAALPVFELGIIALVRNAKSSDDLPNIVRRLLDATPLQSTSFSDYDIAVVREIVEDVAAAECGERLLPSIERIVTACVGQDLASTNLSLYFRTVEAVWRLASWAQADQSTLGSSMQ